MASQAKSQPGPRPVAAAPQTAVPRTPHDERAEEALLGAILTDPDAALDAAIFTLAGPDDFYRGRHKLVFEAIVALARREERADDVTVCAELERRGKLELVGGVGYVTGLMAKVPTAAHAGHYAAIVARCGLYRRVIAVAGQIAALGYENAPDPDDVLQRAEHLVFGLAQKRDRRRQVTIREALDRFFDQVEYLQEHRGEPVGLPTGFRALDKLLGGLGPTDLIVAAGRPGTGKTTFMLQVARSVAAGGLPVGYFSLEMSTEQLMQRLVSAEAAVDLARLRSGYLDADELRRVADAVGALSEAPITLDETPELTASELRSQVRRLASADDPIRLLVVDYLQLLHWPERTENRTAEVSEITRALKGIAREFRIPVLAGAQLSRKVEERSNKRPELSDLRESGSIEQDADIVLLFHRGQGESANVTDLLVEKHRNGPTGKVGLRFLGHLSRFADLETQRKEG